MEYHFADLNIAEFMQSLSSVINLNFGYSPSRFQVGDWVKFRRCVANPAYGWQGAGPRSVGFVQGSQSSDGLSVSFCSGVAHVLADEIIKVIPLDRGQLVQLRPDVTEPRLDVLWVSLIHQRFNCITFLFLFELIY